MARCSLIFTKGDSALHLQYVRYAWQIVRRRAGRVLGWPTARLYPQYDIGEGTYGCPRVCDFSSGTARLVIGSRVSIAQSVVILIGGNHRMDRGDLHPRCLDTSGDYLADCEPAGDVEIRSGAWLCFGCLLVGCRGLIIGRGAVVGAGAVVARNVPDGAVVVGNPARIVRNLTSGARR
jgi:acetyltransferase-like isoleucine patch superfamily enzyme